MSWIKENKFVVALGGGTLAGVILLYVVGSHFVTRYDDAKEQFEAAAAEASSFERLALYPRPENKDGKRKSLEEYRQAVGSVQSAFEPFRQQEVKNISPQEFTSRLLAANTEVRKAFSEAGTTVPEAFFLGFERYKTSLASANTTGLLDYQLGSIKDLMLNLAKAKPTDVRNFHRPALPEEGGHAYIPAVSETARSFPLEITFVGPEGSVRRFLSEITKPAGQYVIVRTLRISNEKKDPPRASDAKFDKPAVVPSTGGESVFSTGFVLPSEETSTPKGVDSSSQPAGVEASVAKVADSSRILSQVLGDEEIQVFLRLDVLQFLPAKKLP